MHNNLYKAVNSCQLTDDYVVDFNGAVWLAAHLDAQLAVLLVCVNHPGPDASHLLAKQLICCHVFPFFVAQ